MAEFLAIVLTSALIQGRHSAYYIFASIVWQQEGFSGLTIASLWVLGVLAEIVVFALSPQLHLQPRHPGRVSLHSAQSRAG